MPADRQVASDVQRPSNHVASLDGLRAVAVLMVLAFHFNIGGVPFRSAGYLGVDLFFVLSGFLITSLLVQERHRMGVIRLRRFYARRALRILPLVGVLLAFGAILLFVTESSYLWRPDPIAFVATAGFWLNWLVIVKPGAEGVFGHTWSLAIEEQFYLVWPPLLAFLLLRRVRLRYIALFLVGALLTAALLRIAIWSDALPPLPASAANLYKYVNVTQRGDVWRRWYYGSFTHMDGLLWGALAALALSTERVRTVVSARPRVARALLLAGFGVGSIVVIAASRSLYADFVPIWGLVLFEACTAVALVCLTVGPATPFSSLLAWPPMVWIGLRSYGIYMLHIPALILVSRFRLGHAVAPGQAGHATTLLALTVTFGLAALSYRLVERPALKLKSRFSASS